MTAKEDGSMPRKPSRIAPDWWGDTTLDDRHWVLEAVFCLVVVLQASLAAAGVPEGFVPLVTGSDGATDREYGDVELHLEWMRTGPGGAGSVTLPSGALVPIVDPAVGHGARADGQWNTLLVRLQDHRVTTSLNGKADAVAGPAADARGLPPARGPIRLQTPDASLQVRNFAIRELGTLDGSGPGWRDLGEEDFTDVNGDADTWSWNDGTVHCTGKPTGVLRTTRPLTNFELAVEWRHLTPGGNSGIFLWAPLEVLEGLPRDKLPAAGIEVQVLDHAFTAQYEKATGKKATWFSTDGDVFAVGRSAMRPFPPLSPNGTRSFPSARHSRGAPEWNRYYVRAIDGEVRLWVNGHEVSGGTDCRPATGYLCLESEGAPVEFRRLRIRELPDPRATPAAASP
jgi:hypothetical protein